MFSIPKSGPLDTWAPKVSNLLVGNDPNVEVIETTLKGPRVYFWADAVVAVSGAFVEMRITGCHEARTKRERKVRMWTRLAVRAGDTLHLGMVCRGGGV